MELAYRTSGDPTKNVSVTNWSPFEPVHDTLNLTLADSKTTSGVDVYTIDISEYKQVSIGTNIVVVFDLVWIRLSLLLFQDLFSPTKA